MKLIITPVTLNNRTIVEKLEIHQYQQGYIESVKECMKEADDLKDWKPVCIMDNNTIVGFAMYGRICEETVHKVWLDRLLIDKRFQHQGYAKRAVKMILQDIAIQYPKEDVYLSVYEENQPAISLYQSFGFRFTGELDTKGEKIMVLNGAEIPQT